MRPTRQTKFITLHLESFVSLRVQLVQILDVVNNSITKGESWIQGNDEIGTFSQVNQLLEFEMSSCLKQLCLIAGEKEDAIPISQHLVQDSSKKKSPSVKSSDHEIWSLTTVIAAPIADSDLMSQFKKPSGSWECQTCLINNKLDVSRCRVCETPRAGSSIQSPAATNSLTGLFKKHPGNWECDTCMIQNAASALRCVACDSPKLGLKAASVVAKSAEPKSSALTVSPTGGFVFNVPTTTATTFDSDGFKFGNTSTISDSTSTGFQFGKTVASNSSEVSKSGLSSAPLANGFKFGNSYLSDVPQSGGFKFGNSNLSAVPQSGVFKFGNSNLSAVPQAGGFKFGNSYLSAVPQAGGFKFGNSNLSAVSQAGGFKFVNSNLSAVPQAGGFKFGNSNFSAVPQTGGFKFGDSSTQRESSNALTDSSSSNPGGGLKFGSSSSAATTVQKDFQFGIETKNIVSSESAASEKHSSSGQINLKSSSGGFQLGAGTVTFTAVNTAQQIPAGTDSTLKTPHVNSNASDSSVAASFSMTTSHALEKDANTSNPTSSVSFADQNKRSVD